MGEAPLAHHGHVLRRHPFRGVGLLWHADDLPLSAQLYGAYSKIHHVRFSRTPIGFPRYETNLELSRKCRHQADLTFAAAHFGRYWP